MVEIFETEFAMANPELATIAFVVGIIAVVWFVLGIFKRLFG